jgi:AraC-like DNA-binding protein
MEYYHYPSPLAERCWYYVQSIGKARVVGDYRHQVNRSAGFLLHFVRRGTLAQQVRRERFEIRAGMAILMDRSLAIQTLHRGTQPAEVWWVSFNGRDLPHLFAELRADRMQVFALPEPESLARIFEQLHETIRLKPAGHEARAFAALAGIIGELFASRHGSDGLTLLPGNKAVLSEPVRKGVDYMVRHYMDSTLNLYQVSDAAGVSARHLCRLFHGETGLTPTQYLRRYRIEQAKQLLAFSDKTIEEVADLVGIPNQSHFAHVFRQIEDITPRAHRAASLAKDAE